MLVSLGEAAKHYKVSTQTITRWALMGKLGYVDLPSGRRKYTIPDVGNTEATQRVLKRRVCYCRASTLGDLEPQIDYLRSKFSGCKVYSDISTGIDHKRPGLKDLLRHCISGGVESVEMTRKDSLGILGSAEILENILSELGVKVTYSDEDFHQVTKIDVADTFGRVNAHLAKQLKSCP